MELEDDKRTSILRMGKEQLWVLLCQVSNITLKTTTRNDVARFVNSYPTLEVTFELVKGDYKAGSPINIRVFIMMEDDKEPEGPQAVVAPYYPVSKSAHWWLVIGQPSTRQLLAIKRVTVKKTLTVTLEFTLPKGSHDLKLYAICDSYSGADHDLPVDTIEVAEGEESDSDEDMESADGSE